MRHGCEKRGKARYGWRTVAVLMALNAITQACSSGKGSREYPESWLCGGGGGTCSCFLEPPPRPGVDSGSSGSSGPDTCEGYTCCWTEDTNADYSDCDCNNSAACDAEIGSRPGTRRVPACPPADYVDSLPCAAAGENCRGTYLFDNDLRGCCSNLVCKPGDGGVPVCQPGTEQERQDSQECQSPSRDIVLLDPIVSTIGTVSIEYFRADKVLRGPGGCLAGVTLSLESCELQLGPEHDASGALIVKTTPAGNSLCPYKGLGEGITGVATFSGLSCEAGILEDISCYAGTFEFAITSQVDSFYPDKGALTGVPFKVRGGFCPYEIQDVASCNG